MLSISTTPNDTSLLNIASHLLQETPSNEPVALELTGMIRTENSSWNDCLRVANMLLNNRQIDHAKKLIAGIDVDKCFQQAPSVLQINLLLRAMVLTGKGDKAFFLLESTNMAERFSVFDDMDIQLRIANALLSQNQIHQAKKLIANFDIANYIRQSTSVGQVNLLLNTLTYVERFDEIVRLLEDVKIIRLFSGEALIDLKLNVATKLIMQGRREEAINFLSSMDLGNLTSPTSACLIAHSYTQLGMFDAANDFFGIVEKKGLISGHFYIFKAILHYCLQQMGNAEESINKNIDQYGEKPPSLFWKSHLFNFNGRHQEALTWLDNLLNAFPLAVPVHEVFIYVEKGNTLRSLGRFDESLEFYRKAEKIDLTHKATFWSWISYFEHAITLFYLGENDLALQIAKQGSRLNSCKYSNRYNPCTILWQFLLHRYKETPSNPKEWVQNAKLWPFPYFNHKMWMLLLAAIALSDQKGAKAKDSEVIINDMVNDQTIVALNHQHFINGILANSESWKNQGVLNVLSAAIWPHHAERAFERTMVRKLVSTQ